VSATILAGALVVVPGPGQTLTFVRQERGPYAGSWLLPGGKVEPGEHLEAAARREALEEAGCVVTDLVATGMYEILDAAGAYHFMLTVFRALGCTATPPEGFTGHHVGEVRQVPWDEVRPHPTVMQILNDAGVAQYLDAEIKEGLRRDGITMRRVIAGFVPPRDEALRVAERAMRETCRVTIPDLHDDVWHPCGYPATAEIFTTAGEWVPACTKHTRRWQQDRPRDVSGRLLTARPLRAPVTTLDPGPSSRKDEQRDLYLTARAAVDTLTDELDAARKEVERLTVSAEPAPTRAEALLVARAAVPGNDLVVANLAAEATVDALHTAGMLALREDVTTGGTA
jgi:8-oxo-dGTP diphosphatase